MQSFLKASTKRCSELEEKSSLTIQQRVHLIPRANVLVAVGKGSDSLILRSFDLMQALEDEGIDYLIMESTPRRRAERDTEYNYPMKVRSRKGSVKFSLQVAPEGMTISSEGVLTWNVPRKYEGSEAPVIVQVSDDSGREIIHSFRLSID